MPVSEIALAILLSGPAICMLWMIIVAARLVFGEKVARVPTYVIDKSSGEQFPTPTRRRDFKPKTVG